MGRIKNPQNQDHKQSICKKFKMNSSGFQMGPIQVIVKVNEVPAKPQPPVPCDSMADTMYFITMMKQEQEEQRRKERDQLIVKMAMEQKLRKSSAATCHCYKL